MPLGLIPWNSRLGFANLQFSNADGFGTNVLDLPANFPIYQQQLVHNTEWHDGPSEDALWCGTQNSASQSCTIREISAHDTQFARRNLSAPGNPNKDFLEHRSAYTNQLYYVNSEPELGSRLSTGAPCSNCFEPRDRQLDPYLSAIFPNPNTQFWEPAGVFEANCADLNTPSKRIRSDALAYVYLRLRRETVEELGRDHLVLPPSSADARLGWIDPDHPNPDSSAYWQQFYNIVHVSGITKGGDRQDPIPTSVLPALHFHHYSNSPLDYPTMTPLQSVAMSATFIRRGVEWYRTSYPEANPLPSNILLSEMGPHYEFIANPRHWAGDWKGFMEGLEWWNSWLCWLTRNAPNDCNLQGWDTGSHTLHACIHHPESKPFTSRDLSWNSTRNQWYFNSDTWDTHVAYGELMYNIPQLIRQTTPWRAYETSFTYYSNTWNNHNWIRTPFGVCYAVWARVGPDPVTTTLGNGWVRSLNEGIIGNVNLTLPATGPTPTGGQGHYSTVYIPIIKGIQPFDDPATQLFFEWVHPDGWVHPQGLVTMGEFSDSGVYPYNDYNQTVYSAMVVPVVCSTTTQKIVTLRIRRSRPGPELWVGRPIVFPFACSWFITQ